MKTPLARADGRARRCSSPPHTSRRRAGPRLSRRRGVLPEGPSGHRRLESPREQAAERAKALMPKAFCGPDWWVDGCDYDPEFALDSWRVYVRQWKRVDGQQAVRAARPLVRRPRSGRQLPRQHSRNVNASTASRGYCWSSLVCVRRRMGVDATRTRSSSRRSSTAPRAGARRSGNRSSRRARGAPGKARARSRSSDPGASAGRTRSPTSS